jgi:hypothetical protein
MTMAEPTKQEELAGIIPQSALDRIGAAIEVCNASVVDTITDDAQYERTGQILREVRGMVEELGGKMRELCGPWEYNCDQIRSHFRPVLEQLADLDKRAADALGAHYGKLQRSAASFETRALLRVGTEQNTACKSAARQMDTSLRLLSRGKPEEASAAAAVAEQEFDGVADWVAPVQEPRRPAGLFFSRKTVAKIVNRSLALNAMIDDPDLSKCLSVDTDRLEQLHAHNPRLVEMKLEGVEFVDEYRPRR